VSEPLVITIGHRLGREEALRRVKPALSKASEAFPVLKVEEEVWSGDRMDFRVRALGQVAAGNVQVTEDHVRLEVTMAAAEIRRRGGEDHQRTRPDPS
jgi:Putative polyhydroxyalkanoic acid system protein (PHA_gran_rgn)